MSDPFDVPSTFDANAFANSLRREAATQRQHLENEYRKNVASLWHRHEDEHGPWTLERVQQVLDALGPAGSAVFAASGLIGYVAAVGTVSKTDPSVFVAAATALQGVLTPYFADGTISVEDFASPVQTSVNADGSVTIDPSETDYPGPLSE